jgi:hypothetical protein
MTYTPNVPQKNQQIATTQQPILNNFGFLPAAIGQEHNFNVADATQTYHKQASMPNQSTPSVPASTNGVYYIKNAQAWFTNGILDVQLSLNNQLPGYTPFSNSVTVASAGPVSFTPNISGNVAGEVYVARTSDSKSALFKFYNKTPATTYQQVFTINPTSNAFTGNTTIQWSGTTLQLNIGSAGTYVYFGWFYPTA